MELLGWHILTVDGRLAYKSRSRRKVLAIRDHLAGEAIPDDSPAWRKVYTGLAADLGIALEDRT
jgi:hypothetical protein